MKKFLIFSGLFSVSFLIGRGFQIALDYPYVRSFAQAVEDSINSLRGGN